MPSLLDRYIARQYLVNVITLFVILFSFIITVDIAVNIDRIWNRAGELAASGGGEPTATRQLVLSVIGSVDLWWPRILQLFNFINGLVLAGAMGFTCAQLVRHRELVAVLASGQSLRRVLRPILVIALLFSAVQLANQELVMPRIAHLLTRDHGDAGKRLLGTAQLELTEDGLGRLVYAESFDADEGTLEGLHVWFRDDAGRALERLTADHAEWDGAAWILEGGTLAPAGAVADPTPVERFETDLDPTAITMRRYRRQIGQNLSWSQLTEMLARRDMLDPARRDELVRLKYGRVTMLLTQLLTLSICAPLFITRVPGGMIVRALKAAPVAVGGTLGAVFATSTPIPGLPAIVGVALPVIILSPLAVASVSAMRT